MRQDKRDKASLAVAALQQKMANRNVPSAIDVKRERALNATQMQVNKALKKLHSKLKHMFLLQVTPEAQDLEPVLMAFLAKEGIRPRSHNLKLIYDFSPIGNEKGLRKSQIKFSNDKGQNLILLELWIQFRDPKQSSPSVTAYIGTVNNK